MSVASESRKDPRSNLKGKRKTTDPVFASPHGSPQPFMSTTSTEYRDGWQRTRESVARALANVIPDEELAKHNINIIDVEAQNPSGPILTAGVEPGIAESPIQHDALLFAAEQLLVIWDSVQEVEFNRLACLRLVERSADILHSVLEESREVREGDLDEPIKKLLGTLQQVAELLAKLAHQPFLKRYLKREETLREIERCHTLLTDSVTIFSISVQIRVLKHLQAVERARSYNTEEFKGLEQQIEGVGMPAPTPADLSLGLENVEKNAKAASDTAVLRAIVEWNALENKQDSVRDAADLRAVLNLALTQNSDFEMLRILQLDRENLPEAVKILQRALEDAEAEVLPAYTPGVGPPEYAAIGADQKLLVGVIGALQRMSETAVKKLPSPTESIASVANLPEPDGPASSRSSLALSNNGSGSGASLELYDENGLLAEQHKERSYRILLQHDFHPSLSLPLWNPIPVSIGTVGYLDERSGLFVTLFEIPSADRDAMTIKTRHYARRTAAQRGFDILTGVVSSWISDTDSPSISRTYSHPLQRASYLMANPATYTYVDGTRTVKEWFKNNVDSIIREYGLRHQIEREDLRFVISTLDAENYAMFVNHKQRDGQVHFNVFASPKTGQPWGEFIIDSPAEGEPNRSLSANKVSTVGNPRKTLLVGCLRFKLDMTEPTSLGGFMSIPVSHHRPSPFFSEPIQPKLPPLSMEIPREKSLKVRRADSKVVTGGVEPLNSDTSDSHFPQIYYPSNAKHLLADVIAFHSADVVSLEKELAAGGTVLSVHSVPDAVAWVEAHYDEPLLSEIRASNFDGPLAIPLSPVESTLAIFGPISDAVIAELARELAQLSGFPVMVRPSVDNPILNFEPDVTPPGSTSGGDVSVGKVTRLRGGAGDGELGSEEIPKWEGKYHSETLDLRLKLSDDLAYDVNVCSFIKFKTQSMANSNPAIFRPRPEVLSLVSLDVKLRRGETQLDRSFSNIGLLAHRPNSILKCDFLDVGFEPPDAVLKRTSGQSTSVNGGGTFGLTGVVPSFTITGGYTRGGSETVESADVKPPSKCNIRYDPGKSWEPEEAKKSGKDFKSYDVAWFPTTDRDKVAYELRVEFGLGINIRHNKSFSHPRVPPISSIVRNQIVIWVKDPGLRSQGRGIMLLTSTYISDAMTNDSLTIHSSTTANLDTASNPPIPVSEPLQIPDETGVSVSVVPLDKSKKKQPSRIGKFLDRLSLKPSPAPGPSSTPRLPTYETVSRGWDSTNMRWKNVLWPTLDRQLKLIDKNGSSEEAAWKLEWNSSANTVPQGTTQIASAVPNITVSGPARSNLNLAAVPSTSSVNTDPSPTNSTFDKDDATLSTRVSSDSGANSKNVVL